MQDNQATDSEALKALAAALPAAKRAEIYIEDDGDSVAVMFRFMGEFDKDSRAHQLCNIIRKYCDSIMSVGEQPAES